MKFPSLNMGYFTRGRLPTYHPGEPWTHLPAPKVVPAEGISDRRESHKIAWILGLYACIAVPLALYLNIWIDESYTLFATSQEFGFIIPHSRDFMLQPPAFFLLLWFWRRISLATSYARMFPVLIVGLTLWLAYRTARKWFPNFSSAWVILPLAVNPWVLFAATELRSYCLVLLCTTAMLYFYKDAFLAGKVSRQAQVLFMLTALLAVNTYYYLVFPLVGGGVALLVGKRWRALRDYTVLMTIVAATFVPQLLRAIEHAETITFKITEFPNLVRATVYTSGRIISTEVDYFVFDQQYRIVWFAVIAAGLIWAALVRWRHWTFERAAIPIITVMIALQYIALTWRIAGEESFYRHFLVVLLPLHLSIVAIVANFESSGVRALRGVMLSLVIVGIACSVVRYAPLAKVGDYRRVARFIESNEKVNEPIVLVASHTELPFRHYYRGENEVIPLPEHDPLERYDIQTWALTSTEEMREKLSGIRPHGRIWVYADRPPDSTFYGVDLGYNFLEQVLAEDYTVLTEQNFYYAKLRQFEKKPSETNLAHLSWIP